MLQTIPIEIDRHTYKVQTFGAKVGRQVLFRLTQMAGPLLATIASKGDLAAAMSGSRPEDFEWLCDRFAEATTVRIDGAAADVPLVLVFDDHFAARYLAMCKWLAHGIRINFDDFFSEAAKRAGVLAAPAAKASETPRQE